MSIPGLAPPVRRGDAYLVDGGLLDNVLVDIIRRSWLRSMAGRGPEPLPKIAETLARTTVIGSWRAAEESRALASVLIQPEVGSTGVLDFHLIDEMVELGRNAAIAALERQPLPTPSRSVGMVCRIP